MTDVCEINKYNIVPWQVFTINVHHTVKEYTIFSCSDFLSMVDESDTKHPNKM